MSSTPIAIIGGGPAGLTAALESVRRDHATVVLEKEDQFGGIARTVDYRGYLFDIGGHRYFTKVEKINRLWQDMLGEDLLSVSRRSSIYYRGKYLNYHLAFSNALTRLGPLEALSVVASYLKARIRPIAEEETFEQWVVNRFGWRLYEIFFKAYTEKVWGLPCSEIRAEWAAQRIKGLSLMTALTHALLGGQKAKTLIDQFLYPLQGPGMMWRRFSEAIEAQGGDVRTRSEVIRLQHAGGRIGSLTLRDGDGETALPVSQVISSMPITELVDRLDPPPPGHVLDAAANLRYRAFIVAGLILNVRDCFPGQWIYVQTPEVKVGRVQNFKNWSPAMVPDPDMTNLGLEYFCDEGDKTWEMPDRDILALAAKELALLGLGKETDVTDGVVLRQKKAYPVYDEGYADRVRVIRTYMESIENLQTIGRNGMHRYNNMDHSMLTGLLAVENLSGRRRDLWEVNEDQEYHEEEDAGFGEKIREKVLSGTFAKMDKAAMALATGAVSGLFFFGATLWLVIKGGDRVGPTLALLAQFFVGYTVTLKGAFLAFAYAGAWGLLLGWLFAYLRNLALAMYIYRIRKKAEILSLKDFFDHL